MSRGQTLAGIALLVLAVAAPRLLVNWYRPHANVGTIVVEPARTDQARAIIQKIVNDSERLKGVTVHVSEVHAYPRGHRQVNGWIEKPRATGTPEAIAWKLLLRQRRSGDFDPSRADIDGGENVAKQLEHDDK